MNTEHLTSIYERYVRSKSQQKPVSKDSSFIQALILEDKKNYKEALNLYNTCKNEYPMDALLSLKIASVLEKLNRKDESKEIIFDTIKNKLITNYDALNAFKIHSNLFLERHIMAEFILKNKENILDALSNKTLLKKVNQNKCFVFWNKPQTAPNIVKAAIESQRKNVGDDFDFVLLDNNNIYDYIQVPEYISKIKSENPTHFSDWLRTELLTNYGGVWLDATCYISKNLSISLSEIKKQDCFFFCYAGSRVGSWFIYSKPTSYILNMIQSTFNLWWKNEKHLTNYFMYHDIIEMLYWTDEKYKLEWDNMYKVHPKKALALNNNLTKPFDLDQFISITNDYFIHKLTYKFDKSLYESASFIKYISNLDKIQFIEKNSNNEKNNTKKLWIFSSYNWQGNPKALFLYMQKNYQLTHECWWISENKDQLETLKKSKIKNIIYYGDKNCLTLFSNCDAYITENFREKYPETLPKSTKIINLWHGVGLKHVELALGTDSALSNSIVKKYIKNFKLYKNQTYFLATSSAMEKHFIEDTVIEEDKILRGPYPRNIVYKDIKSYDYKLIFNPELFNNVILFAPTYRIKRIEGVLNQLIPNFDFLAKNLIKNNNLFIIKVHPFMTKDSYYLEMKEKYKNNNHILFWDDKYDIYEIFNLIDVAIIDYSSIFYDLIEANVKKFIRYIPDYEDYKDSLELIGDYFALTDGELAYNFESLISSINKPLKNIQKQDQLMSYFFSYSKENSIENLIKKIDSIKCFDIKYAQLHSFDVFDTLIRRSTVAPYSIFAFMQKQILISNYNFPQIFKDSWISIRNQVEIDVRDMFRKTTFERGTDKIEINFDLIYERLQKNYQLSDEQIQYLKSLEIQAEINHVEPIQHRINYLFEQKKLGHDVILISDMYLPESVIRKMLAQADQRLTSIPLYLSNTIGHQKSTGKLYKYIFFEKKYQYEKWIHYGDNSHADGIMPRKFGIETRVHQMDSFIPFENKLIDKTPNYYKYEAYQLAACMQRYRQKLLCESPKFSNEEIEKAYYAYAYVGSLLVPYVHWTILDALKRGYETLYFISRDGHYLKMIADELIQQHAYPIKSKFIYGSRKAWRLPSYIDDIDEEMFEPFGNFVGMDCFDDLVRASYLSETELLELFPQFEVLKSARHLRGQVAENIRSTLAKSEVYRKKVLKISAEKRVLVRQYIQENIDFSEKFAFVEFWGRGYTQDTFARLLADAAGQEILNPFYYIRSFKPEDPINLRHNFVLAPVNFSFFEPIFASTPYASISAYIKNDNFIEAVIHPNHNDHYRHFEKGLIDFTRDYAITNIEKSINFARIVNEHSYSYQIKELNDQFICNVFGNLKDNISSYGEPKQYAPSLTVEDLESLRDKKDIDKLTSSIAISLSRSSESTRDYYQKIVKKLNLPNIPPKPITKIYPQNDLKNYIHLDDFPKNVVSIKSNAIYMDINLTKESKRLDRRLAQGEVFTVTSMEWLKNGIPRLVTEHGYVTANRDWVLPLNEAEGVFVRKNEFGEYESIIKAEVKPINSDSTIYKFIKLLEHPYKALNNDSELEHIQKKWRKFTRNPYQFFADSKNDKVVIMKHLFNEEQKLGKRISNWIRKNL